MAGARTAAAGSETRRAKQDREPAIGRAALLRRRIRVKSAARQRSPTGSENGQSRI